MKKLIIIPILLISFIEFQSMHALSPTIKWHFDFNDNSFGQAAAADIDGDGKLEIVFGTYRNDSCVYALNSEDGSLLWKFNSGGCNDAAPLIYDVNYDSTLEVIIASSCVPTTFCLNGVDGTILWTCPTRGTDSPPSIADIDNDEKLEILHGEFNGWVIGIDAETGVKEWEILVDSSTNWIQTAPTIIDINKDGQLDFVVASWGTDTSSSIWAYLGDNLELLWRSNIPQGHIYHGTSYADIDNDGKDELLNGSYDGKVYALNSEDGSLLWDYEFSEDNLYYIGAPLTIADINNDKKYEIIFNDFDIVGVLSEEGNLLWHYQQSNYATTFRGVVTSDINGDNFLDLIFGNSKGILTAINGFDKSLLFSLDLAEHLGKDYKMDSAPLVADFDNDGVLDVFITGGYSNYPDVENNYGRAYLVSTAEGNGPDWLMFQRNHWRNACIQIDKSSGINNNFKIESNSNILFLSDVSIIEYFNSMNVNTVIEIYSLTGKLITKDRLYNKQNIFIHLNSLYSNIYLIRTINSTNQTILYYLKM